MYQADRTFRQRDSLVTQLCLLFGWVACWCW